MDQHQKSVIDKVAAHGWMVIGVSPHEGRGEPQEWFAHTVGLYKTFGWPELICFNQDQALMHKMLDNAVRECVSEKQDPAPGLLIHHAINEAKMRLGFLEPGGWSPRLGWAFWYAEQVGLPAQQLQCLRLAWPDADGLFPDDPGCDPDVRRLQTPLAGPTGVGHHFYA